MSSSRTITRTIFNIAISFSTFSMPSVAMAATFASIPEEAVSDDSLQVGSLARAEADIQIRRIKSMMSERRVALEANQDENELEKFQLILHGQN